MRASVHKFIGTLFLGAFSVFASVSLGLFNVAIAADQEAVDQTDLLTELARLNTLPLSRAAVSTLQSSVEMAIRVERPYSDGGQLSRERLVKIAEMDIQALIQNGMTPESYGALKGVIQALTKLMQEEVYSSSQTPPQIHPASQQLGRLALRIKFSPHEWPMALQLGALDYGPWCFDVYRQKIERCPVCSYSRITPAVSSYGKLLGLKENAIVFSTRCSNKYDPDFVSPDLDILKLMLPVYDTSNHFTHLLCDFNDRDCTGDMRAYFLSLLPTGRFNHVEISDREWRFFNTPEEVDIFTQMIATSTQLKGLVLLMSTRDGEQTQISQGIGCNQSLELLVLRDWHVFPSEWQNNRTLKYILTNHHQYASTEIKLAREQAIEGLGFTKRDNKEKERDNRFFEIYSTDTLSMCELYIRNDLFSAGFPKQTQHPALMDKFNNFPE